MILHYHARIQKYLSEGVQLFLIDEGREDPNITISGPSSGGPDPLSPSGSTHDYHASPDSWVIVSGANLNTVTR